MSSREVTRYRNAIFNLNRERQGGRSISLDELVTEQQAGPRTAADRAAQDKRETAYNAKTGLSPDRNAGRPPAATTSPTPDPAPANPTPAAEPTQAPAVGNARSAQQLYRQLLASVAGKIGTVANPNDQNTILGAMRVVAQAEPEIERMRTTTPVPVPVPTPAPRATEDPSRQTSEQQRPVTPWAAPPDQTKIGKLIQERSSGWGGALAGAIPGALAGPLGLIAGGYAGYRTAVSEAIFQVELRVALVDARGNPGPSNAEFIRVYESHVSNAVKEAASQVWGQNSSTVCTLSGTRLSWNFNYVPMPNDQFDEAGTPGSEQERTLFESLRRVLDTAENTFNVNRDRPRIKILVPTEPGYEYAYPASGSGQDSAGSYLGQGVRNVVRNAADAGREIFDSALEESFNSLREGFSVERLQKLSGIISEQILPPDLARTAAPRASIPLGDRSGSTQTASTQPRPEELMSVQPEPQPYTPSYPTPQQAPAQATAQSAALNQELQRISAQVSQLQASINTMIDQAIASAQRLAPEANRLASNPSYASQRETFRSLGAYLAGQFVTQMNAVKNMTDPQQKMQALLAIYTPNNRGTLTRYMFPLGRIAASERRS